MPICGGSLSTTRIVLRQAFQKTSKPFQSWLGSHISERLRIDKRCLTINKQMEDSPTSATARSCALCCSYEDTRHAIKFWEEVGFGIVQALYEKKVASCKWIISSWIEWERIEELIQKSFNWIKLPCRYFLIIINIFHYYDNEKIRC